VLTEFVQGASKSGSVGDFVCYWSSTLLKCYKQGADFDDMSSFFPCILCDARKYIDPRDELLVTEMQLS
jgi:hypothetical protein